MGNPAGGYRSRWGCGRGDGDDRREGPLPGLPLLRGVPLLGLPLLESPYSRLDLSPRTSLAGGSKRLKLDLFGMFDPRLLCLSDDAAMRRPAQEWAAPPGVTPGELAEDRWLVEVEAEEVTLEGRELIRAGQDRGVLPPVAHHALGLMRRTVMPARFARFTVSQVPTLPGSGKASTTSGSESIMAWLRAVSWGP